MELSVRALMSVSRRLKDGLLGCFLQDRFDHIHIIFSQALPPDHVDRLLCPSKHSFVSVSRIYDVLKKAIDHDYEVLVFQFHLTSFQWSKFAVWLYCIDHFCGHHGSRGGQEKERRG